MRISDVTEFTITRKAFLNWNTKGLQQLILKDGDNKTLVNIDVKM
ncbi:MAG: hypothetical protein R3Y13_05580 [bacterium]